MLGGNAGRFYTPSVSAGPHRIFAVPGFPNRTNDIVYCPPLIRQLNPNDDDSAAIVYFGGDVQDFPESMETNRDSRGYMKYNLENSAILLRNAFPRSHIIVVRPVRMEFKTFSCFDNFVRGNNAGVPDHTPMNHALQHLEKLLQNLSHRLISMPENELIVQTASTSDTGGSNNDSSQEIDIDILQVQENVTVDSDGSMVFPCNEGNRGTSSSSSAQVTVHPITTTSTTSQSSADEEKQPNTDGQQSQTIQFNNSTNADCQQNLLHIHNRNPLWWRENLNLDKAKLVLIGFSKGCVVLNQFIYEFHYLKTLTPDDSTMTALLSRITDMYWLDGGHGGQKNTWITARSLLETLTRMGINIHVHVTPYQIDDDRRPWIRSEEKIFNEILNRLCPRRIERHLHFDSTSPNLVTHFEVLQAFCQHIHIVSQQKHQQQLQQQLSQHRITAELASDEN